jgi:hypothetical protein
MVPVVESAAAGLGRVARWLRRVVLPLPEGPRMARISPGGEC